jgi:membrane-associated protease RseP (regulator of RpoE activity)
MRSVPDSDPASWTFLGWLLPIAGYMALGFVAGQANHWAIINFGLLIVTWALAILAHEGGHAVAARLLGFDVHWIVIGNGPRLVTFQLGRTVVAISALPFSGAVLATTQIRKDFRRRKQIISSSGAFANLVLAVAGMVFAYGRFGETFTAPAPFALLAAANIFALRQSSAAGRRDGVLTDLDHSQKLALASEAQIDEMFEQQARY